MTHQTLAQSYLRKAKARVKALRVLFDEESYSDVVQEAQEIVELCLKALLRLAEISLWLRKERELAFYGDIDFIPTLEYDRAAGERAMSDAAWTVERSAGVIDAGNTDNGC
jgi:hypothetical protein